MSGRIILQEPDVAARITMRARLAGAGYSVEIVDGIEDLAQIHARVRPDIVVADIASLAGAGFAALRALDDAALSRRADVIVTSARANAPLRSSAIRAGATTILDKPLDPSVLMAVLRRAMRNRKTLRPMIEASLSELTELRAPKAATDISPMRMHVFAPSQEKWLLRHRALGAAVRRMRLTTSDPASLTRTLSEITPPDVFLLEVTQGRLRDALWQVSEIRSRFSACEARICLLLPGPRTTDTVVGELLGIACDLGVDDILQGVTDAGEILARLTRQTHLRREAAQVHERLEAGLRLAMRDPLTGAYNRRFAQTQIAKLLERQAQDDQPFSILAVDLDCFKSINDTHGHDSGDIVLQETCRRIGSVLRPQDLLVRSGGEEFWIILPDTAAHLAEPMARRIGAAVRGDPVTLPRRKGLARVTVSIGIAEGGGVPGDTSPEAVIARADAALYRAKRAGRDRITAAGAAA